MDLWLFVASTAICFLAIAWMDRRLFKDPGDGSEPPDFNAGPPVEPPAPRPPAPTRPADFGTVRPAYAGRHRVAPRPRRGPPA